MNKKILASVVVLSGLVFGSDVFAADYISIVGEGICEMILPVNALKSEKNYNYEFAYEETLYDDSGEYLGIDKVLTKVKEILPDAIITSYTYSAESDRILFNVNTKLDKNLLYQFYFLKNYIDNDISDNLTDEFTSSKEYLDCKDMAVKSAMKNAVDKAKIFKARIVATDDPKYGSYDKSYIYKVGDDKMIYHYRASYKAVAD
ncbi:MAG: hypothetical protein ACI4N3_01870 [Alphaproteobacteria bacterium]